MYALNTLASLTNCEGLESFVTDKVISQALLKDLAKAMTLGNIKHCQNSMIVLQNICLNSVKDTKQVLRCEELLEQVFKWCKDRMVVISTEAWNVIHFCLHMEPSSRQ